MYKRELSKTQFKHRMRNFWTNRWHYERTPEDWVEKMDNALYRTYTQNLLKQALDKLVLEKKIDKEQNKNLLAMIKSSDKENATVALHVMAQLKPKKFKKHVEKLSST